MKERKNSIIQRRNNFIKKNYRRGFLKNKMRKSNIYYRNNRIHFTYKNNGKFYYNNYRNRHKSKLTNEKLDDDLSNYFRQKGEDDYKNFLDNDIDMYLNKGNSNEKLEEKNKIPPKKDKKIKTIRIETTKKKEENESEKDKHNIKISFALKG